MKFNRSIAVLSFLYFLIGCGSSNVGAPADNKLIDGLINKKSFEIVSQSATPQNTMAINAVANSGLLAPGDTSGLINLIGNVNYLRVHGDSISAYLPFFGERRMGVVYGSQNGGISFDGTPTNYVVKNGKKNAREIRFTINDEENETEHYRVLIYMYPNLRTTININSTHRTSMTYRGNASDHKKQLQLPD